ncbi:PH domain protein, partial [Ichthyophthirius multifiliis]
DGQILKIFVTVRDKKKKYLLKSLESSTQSIIIWNKNIQKVINEYFNQQKVFISQKCLTNYFLENDMLTEEEFVKNSTTGDLLLFQTNNFNAHIQRAVTRSKYDHIAMAVKLKDGILRIFDTQGDEGVQLTEWDTYSVLGEKYGLNIIKLGRQYSQVLSHDKSNGFFCSELMAKAYKIIGLLDQEKSACQYWPKTFSDKYSNELKMLDGSKLGKETSILLNKNIFLEGMQSDEDDKSNNKCFC